MLQYTTRHMGRTGRWWRRRRLARRSVVVDTTSMGALVAGERPAGGVHRRRGRRARRGTLGAAHHRAGVQPGAQRDASPSWRARAPDLERRKVAQLRLTTEAGVIDDRRRRRRGLQPGDA